MKQQPFLRCLSLLLALLCLFSLLPPAPSAASQPDITSCIEGIIAWKTAENGSPPGGVLINDAYLESAGTTAGDWYPFALGRYGRADNLRGYLAVVSDRVSARYGESGRLHAYKATEWHRIALAVSACGGNPRQVGKGPDGSPIDLIADGTYNRGSTVSLGRQGVNGWIWGLIALDSGRYEVPAGAHDTRDGIIREILSQQLPDGGFALSGSAADPDMTAMAIQALSPYYAGGKAYSYTQKKTQKSVTKTVHHAVDEALQALSSLQTGDGGFVSWGTKNVESACQAAVALCCLGIDPESDSRFIKNGKTLLDAVFAYRMPDGGFCHSFTYDPDNPTSKPNQSNSMASEQVLYTLVAVHRLRNGMRSLYDLRPEWPASLKNQICSLSAKINALPKNPSKSEISALFAAYKAIPVSERSYVFNFDTLAAAMENTHVENDAEDITASLDSGTAKQPEGGASSGGQGAAFSGSFSGGGEAEPHAAGPAEEPAEEADSPILAFSLSDRAAVDALPAPEALTTQYYSRVLTLLDALKNADDFEGKESYLEKLEAALARIRALQDEIDSINDDIKDNLYPFGNISLRDKDTVLGILRRCEALGAYDLAKIEGLSDVKKAKAQIDSLERARAVGIVLVIAVLLLVPFAVFRIRRRRRRRLEAKQMPIEEDDALPSPETGTGRDTE